MTCWEWLFKKNPSSNLLLITIFLSLISMDCNDVSPAATCVYSVQFHSFKKQPSGVHHLLDCSLPLSLSWNLESLNNCTQGSTLIIQCNVPSYWLTNPPHTHTHTHCFLVLIWGRLWLWLYPYMEISSRWLCGQWWLWDGSPGRLGVHWESVQCGGRPRWQVCCQQPTQLGLLDP